MKSITLTSAIAVSLAASVSLLSGCASNQQMLANQQPEAETAALNRGRFDLNCPAAKATVLSSDFIQPALRGAWVAGGLERAEYTVGIEGCGKRTSYVVICQLGNDCFAAEPRNND